MGRFVDKTPKNIIRIPTFHGGPVDISGFEPVIAHPRFQLLEDKNQLGLQNKIYPGAQHKRFEHAVGTFDVARHMLPQMDLPPDEERARLIVALLHDHMHIPFCHDLEPIMDTGHNTKGGESLDTYKEAIEECNADFQRVVELFQKRVPPTKAKKGNGFLGADQLDYMFRDPYHIGMNERPDTHYLINYMVYDTDEDRILFEEVAAASVMRTQLLFYDLHTFFYYIKQGLILRRMIQRAVEDTLIDGNKKTKKTEYLDPNDLYDMVDADVKAYLLHAPSELSRSLYERIRLRQLYKTVLTYKLDRYHTHERIAQKPMETVAISETQKDAFLTKYDYTKPRTLTVLEDRIAKVVGEPRGTVLISSAHDFERLADPKDTPLYCKGGHVASLFERYPHHEKALIAYANSKFSLRIAVPEEKRGAIFKKREVIKEIMAQEMESQGYFWSC